MSDTHGPDGVPARKRKPLMNAPEERRQLLGRLLEERRGELGFTDRTDFARARPGLTWRTYTDLENGYRENSTIATLGKIAKAYGVTYDSMIDVAHGRADKLETIGSGRPAGAPDPLEHARPQGMPGSWISPATIADADRKYMPAIRERLDALAGRGITDPDGEELFPGDPGLAGAYEADRMSGSDVYAAAWMAALVAERRERLGRAGRGPQHGSARA